jgi:hypothetical protein
MWGLSGHRRAIGEYDRLHRPHRPGKPPFDRRSGSFAAVAAGLRDDRSHRGVDPGVHPVIDPVAVIDIDTRTSPPEKSPTVPARWEPLDERVSPHLGNRTYKTFSRTRRVESPEASLPPPVRLVPLIVLGLVLGHSLWAAGDRDRRVLLEGATVLRGQFGRHDQGFRLGL